MSVATKTPATGRKNRPKAKTVIACDEVLDISLAQDLYGKCRQALQAQRPVVLDASQVTRVDTAVLQLLSVFCQDAQASDIAVHWQQPSRVLQDAARLLDLTSCLALPLADT